MPAPDDGAWCRPRGGADLSRYRRRTRALQKLQGSWGGVWSAAFQVSIGRDQPNRRDIKVRGRDDAGDALRSGSYHAGAFGEVVLAQGLRHEIARQPGIKKAIVALARRLAVIMHRIWVDGTVPEDPGTSCGSSMRTIPDPTG